MTFTEANDWLFGVGSNVMKNKKSQLTFQTEFEQVAWFQTYAAWRSTVPRMIENLDNDTIDEAAALVADRAVVQFRKRLPK